MNNDNKVTAFLQHFILWVFGIFMIFTMASMLFIKKLIACPPMNRTRGNDILYFVIAVVLSFALFMLLKNVWKAKQYNTKKLYIFMLAASIVMYGVQLIILKCIWFETGWDVTCVYYDAVHRAEEGILLGSHEYFTVHPNNLMITFVFAVVCKMLHLVGISRYYLVLCCLGALLINVAGYLVFQIVFRLTDSIRTAVIAWLVYMVFIGLGPWMCVPYTDVYAIVFPIAIFYLYLCRPKKKVLEVCKWLLIGFLTVFGYFIKPTVSIMTIAIVILIILKTITEKEKKRYILSIGLIVAGCLCGVLFNAYAKHYMGFIEDEDMALPIAHYLMLGENDETYGVFDGGDRNLTLSFPTKEEKVANGLKVAKERFTARGVLGNLRFFTIKNMVNYDNGTFSWAYEGEFFKDVSAREDTLSVFLRDIYYPEGKYHKIYSAFCQGIWMLILLGCIGLLIEKDWKKYLVPMLAVLGLTLFLLIFESRARYLYLYTPVYVVLGSIGLKNIYVSLSKKMDTLKNGLE